MRLNPSPHAGLHHSPSQALFVAIVEAFRFATGDPAKDLVGLTAVKKLAAVSEAAFGEAKCNARK